MVYFAGKLIENLKLFYKSNRPHFLWVYRRDNPLGILGKHSKSFSHVLPTSCMGYHAGRTVSCIKFIGKVQPGNRYTH